MDILTLANRSSENPCAVNRATVWKFRPLNVPAETDQPRNPMPNPTETFFNEGCGLIHTGAHFCPFRN